MKVRDTKGTRWDVKKIRSRAALLLLIQGFFGWRRIAGLRSHALNDTAGSLRFKLVTVSVDEALQRRSLYASLQLLSGGIAPAPVLWLLLRNLALRPHSTAPFQLPCPCCRHPTHRKKIPSCPLHLSLASPPPLPQPPEPPPPAPPTPPLDSCPPMMAAQAA